MSNTTCRGSIPEIVRNDTGLYAGDLRHYYNCVINCATNCNHPYHNLRHMLHVTWLTHNACAFYQDRLTATARRNLLIGALFHDFDHSGKLGKDIHNIERSINALQLHITDEDRGEFENIAEIIRATEYPYTTLSECLPLCHQIIRDADLSQSLNPAWIQQVLVGLAAEWGITLIEMHHRNIEFLENLHFCTDWAQEMFPQGGIDEKVQETRELLELLDPA